MRECCPLVYCYPSFLVVHENGNSLALFKILFFVPCVSRVLTVLKPPNKSKIGHPLELGHPVKIT